MGSMHMKNKKIVGISLLIIIGLLMLAMNMKKTEGYALENDREIKEVMSELCGFHRDEIYKMTCSNINRNDYHAFIVYVQTHKQGYIRVFEEMGNDRFKDCYGQEFNENESLMIRDTKRQVSISAVYNKNKDIKTMVLFVKNGGAKKINVEDEELILYSFDFQDDEVIGNSVFDENDSNLSYSSKQVTITK